MLTDTLVFLLAGAEAKRSDIPSAVPVEDVAPETQEAAVEASEPMEVVAEGSRRDDWRRGGCHATRTRCRCFRPATYYGEYPK
jgi:hypothetical protein